MANNEIKKVKIIYKPFKERNPIQLLKPVIPYTDRKLTLKETELMSNNFNCSGRSYSEKAMLQLIPYLVSQKYQIIIDDSAREVEIPYRTELKGKRNGKRTKIIMNHKDGIEKKVVVCEETKTIEQLVKETRSKLR